MGEVVSTHYREHNSFVFPIISVMEDLKPARCLPAQRVFPCLASSACFKVGVELLFDSKNV